MHVSSVSPPCLFSLIAFEVWCIGRVLLVLGSRLKNEVYIRIHTCFPAFIFGVYFYCMLYMFVGTKMQAVTFTIIRCKLLLSDGNSTRQVVDNIMRSPNRTKRQSRQT